MASRARIGIIGAGYIGSYLLEQVTSHPEWALHVAFVAENGPAATRVPPDLLLDDLSKASTREPDLIVECAHPSVSAEHGVRFLAFTDYMPLSLTALADLSLERAMRHAAQSNGTCLYIPHGAAVGLDSLWECRDLWESVTATMKKNPRNLDFSASGRQAPPQDGETVLYDGPTREVCALYPRNVNSHAATALAGIGFDRTRSVLICDPALDVSVIQLEAAGGGVHLRVERSNPLKGVSGVLTLRSILGCVQRAKSTGAHFQVC
jgi:aspartate dehydrogenase